MATCGKPGAASSSVSASRSINVQRSVAHRRPGPALLAVVDHDRQERRQPFAVRVLPRKPSQILTRVAQQPEGHERIARTLVFEQYVEVRPSPVAEDHEQQVCLSLVDEARGLQFQRAPNPR